MADRAFVVHATHLLLTGYQVVSDPAQALGAVVGAVRRALAFKEPARGVAVLDANPPLDDVPAVVRAQHGMLRRVLGAHGLVVVETDDAIQVVASYVQAALDGGFDAVVVGSDKRLAQLVGDDVWWYDAYKRVRYTPELVRKRFDVGPEQVAGWLALVGDRDALPGVKGLGKKGVTELVQAHGSVEVALADPDAVEGRSGKAIRASLDDARRELGRAVLDRTRPLPVPLDEVPWTAPSVEDLNALYRELGFHHLLEAEEPKVEAVLCDTAAAAQAWVARSPEAPVAVLAVTDDPSAARGELVGLALSRGDDAAYVPVAILDAVRPWLEDAGRPKIGHDTKSAVVALARRRIDFAGVVGDSECGSHLVDPTGLAPHDLDDISRRVLHRPLPAHDEVRGIGKRRKDWSALKPAKVAAHMGRWAAASADLWRRFEPQLDRDRFHEYLQLSRTLAGMELHGVACDVEDLARSAADFAAMEAEVEGEIHAMAGKEFNVGSTKQLGSVLFEDLGLEVIKRTKTGWSTASSALERIQDSHPIVPLVMRWRLLRWLRTTWTAVLTDATGPDGRVHATFHHARSFSGRIICSQPDLGRVPGRTPEMVRIRHAFHATPGCLLLSVDYDQLGLYVLAHHSGDEQLVSALTSGADLHRITAGAVMDTAPGDVTPEQRALGKVVNFATFAGQGASALALQLGVDAAEAKRIIARFQDHYSGVRDFQEGELKKARDEGFIETIGGRRQYISGFDSEDHMLKAYAIRVGRRATHEGSVADVTRRALSWSDAAVRDAGLHGFPVLQLLDEVLFEVPEDELEETLQVAADAMRSVFDLRVPLRVTAKAGTRWGSLEAIEVPDPG